MWCVASYAGSLVVCTGGLGYELPFQLPLPGAVASRGGGLVVMCTGGLSYPTPP